MGYAITAGTGQTRYNLSPRTQSPKYIVIHYTGTQASARNNVAYFSGGDRGASADWFIDDTGIYAFNPDPRRWYSWHCGDGHGAYGITNANSLGIEVVSDGRDFSEAEIERLAWLVGNLMQAYGIDADHVVRHYDASRKLCPAPYVDAAKWAALKKRITDGKDDDMTDEQAKQLKEIYSQVTKTTDPTGRGKKFNDHDHLKWVAATVTDNRERLEAIEAKLDALIAKL